MSLTYMINKNTENQNVIKAELHHSICNVRIKITALENKDNVDSEHLLLGKVLSNKFLTSPHYYFYLWSINIHF